jgi:hypothetical protein
MLGVLVCVAAAAGRSRGFDKSLAKRDNTPSLSEANSPEELARQIAELLPSAPAEELDRLVSAPDCSTALAAAWERVRRTMPEADPQEIVAPHRQAVSRFLGVLETRLGVPLTKAWEETFKSVQAHSRQLPWFSYPQHPATRFGGLVAPKREGDKWIVAWGSVKVQLPAEDGLGLHDHASMMVEGGIAYVALYGWPPSPYRLLAVEQATGKIMWSEKVWAAGDLLNYEGQGWHFAEISIADERLVVFGISDGSAYVEVLDKKTGKNRCRFSTMYFLNAGPHPVTARLKNVTYEAFTIKQNHRRSLFRGHTSAALYQKWFKSDYDVTGKRVEIPEGATLFGALVLTDGEEVEVLPFYMWGDANDRACRCQGFKFGRAPMFSASGDSEKAFFEDIEKRLREMD